MDSSTSRMRHNGNHMDKTDFRSRPSNQQDKANHEQVSETAALKHQTTETRHIPKENARQVATDDYPSNCPQSPPDMHSPESDPDQTMARQTHKMSLEESRGPEATAQLTGESQISPGVSRSTKRVMDETADLGRPIKYRAASPVQKRKESHTYETQPDHKHRTVSRMKEPTNAPQLQKHAYVGQVHDIRPPDQGGDEDDCDTSMLKQPEVRPITQEQLVNEVKGIYAGLVMVEKKCVEICQQQAKTTTKLSNEQWQALIALHRTLLHEHHDFFLASQHPTASPALRRLATKYAMPARMWRHGIHSFLELLRHRLPDSLDHMLAFVYLAYSMMALLMESVPSFVETWIECLGDLARYRMAIEEADLRDREIWSNVARMWYNKAADRSPNVGRIQHHLAVLARPNIVQQLFYYSKALVSVVPFVNARESVMLLYTPFLENSEMTYQKYPIVESSLVTAFGILFTRGKIQDYQRHTDEFISGLDPHISRTSSKFKVQGPEICSSLIAGLFDFGNDSNSLWQAFRKHMDTIKVDQAQPALLDTPQISDSQVKEVHFKESQTKGHLVQDLDPELKKSVREEYWASVEPSVNGQSSELFKPSGSVLSSDTKFASSDQAAAFVGPLLFRTTQLVAQKIGDKNVFPYMHMLLAFLWSISYVPEGLIHVERTIPWAALVMWLNTLGRSGVGEDRIQSSSFPVAVIGGLGRQLPEDFPMRGLIWSQHYFDPGFFSADVVDEDERLLELPSHAAPRAERCLWLAVRLASIGRHITYDIDTKHFAATEFAISLAGDYDSSTHPHPLSWNQPPAGDVKMVMVEN